MDNQDDILKLKRALKCGDIEALATMPAEVFLTLYSSTEGRYNLFTDAMKQGAEFLREVISKLPSSEVDSLITTKDMNEDHKNALHFAAVWYDVDILRVLLDFYRSMSSLPEDVSWQRPWLCRGVDGMTPLQMALQIGKGDCALELLSMDMELLCNMVDDNGSSPLLEAVRNWCPKVAVKILTSGCSYCSSSGNDGLTPLHLAPFSTEEVCTLLLDKHPEMLKKRDHLKSTVLHTWVRRGVIWPFHLLLNRVEQTSAWRKYLIDLLCATEVFGNNPLHVCQNKIS